MSKSEQKIVAFIVLLLCGVFIVFCCIKDFEWFFNNRKARFAVRFLGRNGARILYGVIGIGFIIGAVMIFIFG